MPLTPARDGVYSASLDTILASAARTATGQSSEFRSFSATAIVIEVYVTAFGHHPDARRGPSGHLRRHQLEQGL